MKASPLSPSRFRSNAQSPIKSSPTKTPLSPPLRRLNWTLSLSPRERSSRGLFTLGQAVALAALCSSLAAIMTASSSAVFYSNSDLEHALSTRGLFETTNTLRGSNQIVSEEASSGVEQVLVEAPIRPKVAWLMSFPNSGTSFTIHMTREASNTTTATNYALEGEIKDKPSVQAIPGKAGEHGPWLELIPNRTTSMPETIITKTHCKGFCTGRFCGADKTIHTVRSFMTGCLSGTQAVETRRGIEKVDVTYSPSLVSKAIHIFRHPLDNIVARFHLEYNVQKARGNKKYTKLFTKDATGFKRWCMLDDSNRGLLSHRLIDNHLRKNLEEIPCFNEFYRYLQWHNLAFSVSRDMNLPTLLLHYHEYSTDFEATRDKVLHWLELPRVASGVKFHDGKVYRSYYSQKEKLAIRDFLHEFASAETWEQLKDYDFESNDAPTIKGDSKLELSAVL